MLKVKIYFFLLVHFNLILIFIPVALFAQSPSPAFAPISKGKITVKKISKLPHILKECSGIVATTSNKIWAINDGGNEPILYCIDSTGLITDSIAVEDAKNIDWEDITSDGKNFYIGDFGNNRNNRKSFQIYKIVIPDSTNDGSIGAEKIEYTYDGLKLPLSSQRLNYDVESLIVLNDTAYLFSKNRTRPFDGILFIYQLPLTSPTSVAVKYDSLYLGKGKMIDFWISSVALSPDKGELILISYSKIWIFNCIRGSSFFKSKITSLDFEFTSQKESIGFVTQRMLYLTDEKSFPFSEGALYSLDIENYLINDCE